MLAENGYIQLPTIPSYCIHNAHMFYIKCKNLQDRQSYIKYMKEHDVNCVFHYVPLHSSPAGKKFGRFNGRDIYTTSESERLVRLRLYYNINEDDIQFVVEKTKEYFL